MTYAGPPTRSGYRMTLRMIQQNLGWAFAALPLAAIGFLNAVVAGAAMASSSVSVVANAAC